MVQSQFWEATNLLTLGIAPAVARGKIPDVLEKNQPVESGNQTDPRQRSAAEISQHLHEDALEPHHLIRRSDLVLRAGTMMLGAGTGSRRVKETMRQVAKALDLDTMEAQITLTEIVCTVSRRGVFRTQVAEVTQPGVNAYRAAQLQEMGRRLKKHVSVAQMTAKLDRIEARGALYPGWMLVIMVALACTGMVFLNGGSWFEILPVFLASGIAYSIRRKLGMWQFNQLVSVFIAGVATVGGFWCFSELFHLLFDWSLARQSAGFVSAAIFLVPGFPLVTASLDLARLDLEAGIARLTYAGLVMLSAGMGVWVVTALVSVQPTPLVSPDWHPVLKWGLYAIATFMAASGWSFMFNAPLKICMVAGLIATVTNVPKIFAISCGVPSHVAVCFTALTVGVICWVVGNIAHLPKIIMSVPAVIVLVPGSAAYQAMVLFTSGDMVGALTQLTHAILTTIGICVGMAGARILTDPKWSFSTADAKYLNRSATPELPEVGTKLKRLFSHKTKQR